MYGKNGGIAAEGGGSIGCCAGEEMADAGEDGVCKGCG